MKTLTLGLGLLSGMTMALAQGQESSPVDAQQYSIESRVLYVKDALRPEYAESTYADVFGSSLQGAWLAPSGKAIFVSEPELGALPEGASANAVFDLMNVREAVEIISAPRLTLMGWRPGDLGFENGTLFKVLMKNDEQIRSGGGGFGGGGSGGIGGSGGGFSNVVQTLFSSFPTPMDPRFFYGRGIIADIRSESVPYVERRHPDADDVGARQRVEGEPIPLAEIVRGEMEIETGLVIAPRIVEGTDDNIQLDFVLNYQSASGIDENETLTRKEIESRLVRANLGMDLMFDDGETQRIIVPLNNGDFLDVFVTVEVVEETGRTVVDAN